MLAALARGRTLLLARAVVALVLLAGLHSAGAAAAHAAPVLAADVTLSGTRTGYVRVRLPRPLPTERLHADARRMVLTGSGTIGFALLAERDGQRLLVSRVATETGPETFVQQDGPSGPAPPLAAGDYRLFLVTRGGPSAVRLRLSALAPGAARLAVSRPVAFRHGDFAAPVSPAGFAPPTFEPVLDVDVRGPGIAAAVLWMETTATAYHRTGICTFVGRDDRRRSAPACLAADEMGGLQRFGVAAQKHERLWGSWWFAAPAGELGLSTFYADAGAVRSAGALVYHFATG